MAKPTGFMDYQRAVWPAREPAERLCDWNELHGPAPTVFLKDQAARCMDCGVPFCHGGVTVANVSSGCPKRNLIPEWNDLLYRGLTKMAWERLEATSPFPEFTGRVCPAPCEASCTCANNGEAVTIREIELYLAETAWAEGWIVPRPPKVRTGATVAVVGSGPAGLAAAFRLNRQGHEVTVFERSDSPGGLLMYGIPNMKLDKNALTRRIRYLEQEGIRFVLNADIGRNVEATDLLYNYDSLVLACGASHPRDLKVPGRDLSGVRFAVDFLTEATKAMLSGMAGRPLAGKRVLVIGGGDTGNDCVATSLRQGAADVVQYELLPAPPEKRPATAPWPRWPGIRKTDYGQEEAILLQGADPRRYCMSTLRFTGADGRLTGVDAVEVEWLREGGRMTPRPRPETERHEEFDLAILAMGFTGPEEYLFEALRVSKDEGYTTTHPAIFLCGDMRRGQSLVVWAMAEGEQAAVEADRYLRGAPKA